MIRRVWMRCCTDAGVGLALPLLAEHEMPKKERSDQVLLRTMHRRGASSGVAAALMATLLQRIQAGEQMVTLPTSTSPQDLEHMDSQPGQPSAPPAPGEPAAAGGAAPAPHQSGGAAPGGPAVAGGGGGTGGGVPPGWEDKVARLAALGFSPQQALAALRQTGGNEEVAGALLFGG